MIPNKKYRVSFLPLKNGNYWPDVMDNENLPPMTELLFTSSLVEAFKKFNDLSEGAALDCISLDRIYYKEQEYSEILRHMRGGVFEVNLLTHGDITDRLLKGYWRVDIFPHWGDAESGGDRFKEKEDWIGRGGNAYAYCRTKGHLRRFTKELRKLPRSYGIYQPRNRRPRSLHPIYQWSAWSPAADRISGLV